MKFTQPCCCRPRVGRSFLLFFVAALGVALFPYRVAAQDEAKAAFDEGIAAFHEADYPAALEAFESSYALRPMPKVLFNIGMCQKAMYRFVDALETFDHFMETAALSESSPLYREVEVVREELLDKVGRLEIGSSPQPAAVQIDGISVGRTPVVPAHPVDPGDHTVTIELEGYAPYHRTVTVMGGSILKLNGVLEKEQGTVDIRCPFQAELILDAGRPVMCPFVGPLPAGPHRLTLKMGAAPPVERTFDLRHDERLMIDLTSVVAVGSDLSTGATSENAKPEKSSGRSPALLVTGAISTTLAAGAGALGSYFAVQGERAYNDGLAAVEAGDRARYDDISGNKLPAYRMGTVVSFVSCGVLLVTGTTLLVVNRGRRNEAEKKTAFQLTPTGVRVQF